MVLEEDKVCETCDREIRQSEDTYKIVITRVHSIHIEEDATICSDCFNEVMKALGYGSM